MTKKYTPYAVYEKDGKDVMYVEVCAFMPSPFLLFFDALPIVTWGNEHRYYTDIDNAIAWVKNENRENHKYARKYGDRILAGLEKAKKQHLAGTLDEQ